MKTYETPEWIAEQSYKNGYAKGYEDGKKDAVKQGQWVDGMVRDWRCSVCGKKVPRQVHFDGYCYNDKLNYCPECGADMRGEEDA
jgi:rubrerythrin